jgi:hypothetical protein
LVGAVRGFSTWRHPGCGTRLVEPYDVEIGPPAATFLLSVPVRAAEHGKEAP